MAYESFETSKNKLEKNWNRAENNKNKLTTIPITSLDFNSINFNKKLTTIPITSTVTPGGSVINVHTILLKNYPKWALNMVEPSVIYTLGDGFVSHLINISLTDAFNNGTLKNDDVTIELSRFKYWFNNIDKTNFLLKLFYSIGIKQAIVTNLGFVGVGIPVTANISLKIYNHRIYETMNEKFK